MWYPTRYNAKALFGGETASSRRFETAIMAVFAGDDELPGATSSDAALLKSCLEADERVKDFMVKVGLMIKCFIPVYIFSISYIFLCEYFVSATGIPWSKAWVRAH